MKNILKIKYVVSYNIVSNNRIVGDYDIYQFLWIAKLFFFIRKHQSKIENVSLKAIVCNERNKRTK